MNQIHERDMSDYVNRLKSSFQMKREIYTEFQTIQIERGFNFLKEDYVKLKFPKFPNRLKKTITEMI